MRKSWKALDAQEKALPRPAIRDGAAPLEKAVSRLDAARRPAIRDEKRRLAVRIQRHPVSTLDKLDRHILDLLQQDGRMSMTDLAERVGLTVTPCIERVKRLERDGVITGYYARVAPQALDAGLLVFVEISMSSKSDRTFDDFRREILCIPQVQECHLVSGDFDYLVKARIKEISQYRSLLGDILLRLPGVTQTKSCVVMEEVKETLFIAAQK